MMPVPVGVLFVGVAPAAGEYEIGGPLAGVKLPLYKTQHGEPPGYPGRLRNPDGTFNLKSA